MWEVSERKGYVVLNSSLSGSLSLLLVFLLFCSSSALSFLSSGPRGTRVCILCVDKPKIFNNFSRDLDVPSFEWSLNVSVPNFIEL